MNLVQIAIALILVFMALIFFYYSPVLEKKYNVVTDFKSAIGIYFPIVSFLMMILALRGIKTDEKLVRSIDRIR